MSKLFFFRFNIHCFANMISSIAGNWHPIVWIVWHWKWIFCLCVSSVHFWLVVCSNIWFEQIPSWCNWLIWLIQWECWLISIDSCWKSKGGSDLCWIHDFLFYFRWIYLHLNLQSSLPLFEYIFVTKLEWLCRKIWSSLCFNSSTDFCCFVLHFLCLCGYVFTNPESWITLLNSHW